MNARTNSNSNSPKYVANRKGAKPKEHFPTHRIITIVHSPHFLELKWSAGGTRQQCRSSEYALEARVSSLDTVKLTLNPWTLFKRCYHLFPLCSKLQVHAVDIIIDLWSARSIACIGLCQRQAWISSHVRTTLLGNRSTEIGTCVVQNFSSLYPSHLREAQIHCNDIKRGVWIGHQRPEKKPSDQPRASH